MGKPAAKKGDKVIAVDTHIVMVPTSDGSVPTPLPHPFMGTIDDAVSNNVNIKGQPAAVLGSVANNQPPHTPTPPGTSFQKPPMNQGKIIQGSSTVLINGKPAARLGDMAMTCNDPADMPVGKVVVTAPSMVNPLFLLPVKRASVPGKWWVVGLTIANPAGSATRTNELDHWFASSRQSATLSGAIRSIGTTPS